MELSIFQENANTEVLLIGLWVNLIELKEHSYVTFEVFMPLLI